MPAESKKQNKIQALPAIALVLLVLLLWLRSQQDVVRETIVRNQVDFSRTNVCFVAFHNQDPSEKFMQRFAADTTSVRKVSQGMPNPDGGNTWVDRQTGESGTRINIKSLRIIGVPGLGVAQVQIDLPSIGKKCLLVNVLTRWIVVRDDWVWIE